MLRAYALMYGKSRDKSLPYTEFPYNNSYQASIQMAPYEALYGRQCQTPLFWSQTGESQVFRLEVLKDAEKQVQMVCESLKVAQSRQRSYADKRRRDISFEIGDFVYLKVSPMRGTRRFRVKGKLALGRRAMRIKEEETSHLKSEISYTSKSHPRVLEEQLPMEYLDLGGDLTYSERPINILDITERVTRSKVIKMCKVQWSHHTEDEATWEHEEELRADYPELFLCAS
jgi:hypothetical protein